ncbi:unnamed protein product [Dibothriocephalus latus]|uniref:Uncharacterized protein n=1 Tax=Dibothriocephalus latus TaxID=60516 RepID=A0A3P7LJ66_DIBLA|nr:unnamed protein product [Dibothriocephalus latus]
METSPEPTRNVQLLQRGLRSKAFWPLKSGGKEILPFRKISVVVVEAHSDALTHIYRAIGSKKVPFMGLKLLHFDSHPDLCIPPVLSSVVKSDPIELLEKVEIQSWIMPSVFAGHIDHVVWLHPEWSKQLTNRRSATYSIGTPRDTQLLSVNIPEDYFVDEGSFWPAEEMDSPIPFGLTVATIHEANTLCKVCVDIISVLLNHAFILDVDLDTFSTCDPFRNFYSEQQFALIDKLFTPPQMPVLSGVDATTDPEVVFAAATLAAKVTTVARKAQLNQLKDWMLILSSGVSLPSSEIAENPFEVFTLCSLLRSLGDKEFTPVTWAAIESTFLAASMRVPEASQPVPVVRLEDAFPRDQVLQESIRVSALPVEVPMEETGDPEDGDQTCSATSSSPRLPTPKRRSVSPGGPFHMKTRLTSKQCDDEAMSFAEGKEENVTAKKDPSAEKHAGDTTGDSVPDNASVGSASEKDDQALMLYLHDLWSSLADHDRSPLPHHVSSFEEQKELRECMESLLNRLHNPCLITVARSVTDGYTPQEQISDIQLRFFQSLDRIYGHHILSVLLDYDG